MSIQILDQFKEKKNKVVVKVGMLGDSQTGKTTLMVKYIEDKYDGDYIETLTVNYMGKRIPLKNVDVIIRIWDLGGQRQFATLMPLVCSDAKVILFAFDLTQKQSLFSVKRWYKEARKENQLFMPFLVGTKFDLFDELDDLHKQDIAKQARKFAKKMHAPLIYCSSAQSINVKKIFKIIIAKIFDLKPKIKEDHDATNAAIIEFDINVDDDDIITGYSEDVVKELVKFGFGTYDECVIASRQTVNYWNINDVIDTLTGNNRKNKFVPRIEENKTYENESNAQSISTCNVSMGANGCNSINRIVSNLQFYSTLDLVNNKSDHDKLCKYFNEQYKSVLDDYIHIVTVHNKDISKIYDLMISSYKMEECNFMNCLLLQRHHRNRRYEAEKQKIFDGDLYSFFYTNIMDSIHCFLFHLYEIGLRTKKSQYIEKASAVDEYFDAEFANICKSIHINRGRLQKIDGFDYSRLDNNKFSIQTNETQGNTCIDNIYEYLANCFDNENKIRLTWNVGDWVEVYSKSRSCWFHAQIIEIYHDNDKELLSVSIENTMIKKVQRFSSDIRPFISDIEDRIQRLRAMLCDEDFDTDALVDDVIDHSKNSNIGQLLNDDQYDTIRDYVKNCNMSGQSFSIGYIFYYWNLYKHKMVNREKQSYRNRNDHSGYEPHELYIPLKYTSLKDEILNNETFTLYIKEFNISFHKATEYMQTQRVKIIEFIKFPHRINHYGIKIGTKLSLNNVLSIILYCDWSDLCTKFTATFRKLTPYEPISSVKRRNREFSMWSMILRETVEYFGQSGYRRNQSKEWNTKNPTVAGPFFCGMSVMMVVPEFNIRLCGPTSTSRHIEVAARFGGEEGMILTLNNTDSIESKRLRSFDCAWISNYNGEGEQLFMGGFYGLKLQTIRFAKTAENFSTFMKPLFYFDCMINGTNIGDANDVKITKRHYEILDNLIKHKLNINDFDNKYHTYINDTFKAFCNNKSQLTINLYYINKFFKVLLKLIIKQESNVFEERLIKIFKNVREIDIFSTKGNGNRKKEYPINLFSLLSILKSVKSNKLLIRINATHKYKKKIGDKNFEHIDESWIFKLLNNKSLAIQSTFRKKQYNIIYTETNDATKYQLKQDCLKIYHQTTQNEELMKYHEDDSKESGTDTIWFAKKELHSQLYGNM